MLSVLWCNSFSSTILQNNSHNWRCGEDMEKLLEQLMGAPRCQEPIRKATSFAPSRNCHGFSAELADTEHSRI